jgi:hypothetical protein
MLETKTTMVTAAMAAEEMGSAFQFAFGDNADVAQAQLGLMADQMGRSEVAMQRLALSYQQLLGPAGGFSDETADMSVQLAALTQDISSFYDISQEMA